MGNTYEYKDWSSESVYVALTTDKPVYKPGDTFFLRILFFNHTSKEPVTECDGFHPTMYIQDSQDNELYSASPDWSESCSDAGFLYTWKIPDDQSGGLFRVKVEEYEFPAAIMSFRIREYHEK